MPPKKGWNILVADDNEINLKVITGMLEYAGHRVDAVVNGQEAIETLEKKPYDLVILDCLMPVMDGFAAARTIRSSSVPHWSPGIPILAVTALATPEDQQRCLEAGMSGYISKPVEARELYAWIANNVGAGAASHRISGPRRAGRQASKNIGTATLPRPNKNSDLARKFSQELVRDAGAWQLELKQLGDTGNLTRLSLLAHKIRGTADVLGFIEVSAIAAKLERSGNAGGANESADLVPELILALGQLIDQVNQVNG